MIFIVILISFSGCMSAHHLSNASSVKDNHTSYDRGSYSNYSGGGHSSGCH
jgi:hypothetical protein